MFMETLKEKRWLIMIAPIFALTNDKVSETKIIVDFSSHVSLEQIYSIICFVNAWGPGRTSVLV